MMDLDLDFDGVGVLPLFSQPYRQGCVVGVVGFVLEFL
jgi:hypothetical protein